MRRFSTHQRVLLQKRSAVMTAFKSHWKALPAGVIYEDFNTLVVCRVIRIGGKSRQDVRQDVHQMATGILKPASPVSEDPP